MYNVNKLSAEFSTISETDFWKLYHQKISEKRAADSRACEMKEVVAKYQGSLEMADFILGRGKEYKPLAERIMDELQNHGEK